MTSSPSRCGDLESEQPRSVSDSCIDIQIGGNYGKAKWKDPDATFHWDNDKKTWWYPSDEYGNCWDPHNGGESPPKDGGNGCSIPICDSTNFHPGQDQTCAQQPLGHFMILPSQDYCKAQETEETCTKGYGALNCAWAKDTCDWAKTNYPGGLSGEYQISACYPDPEDEAFKSCILPTYTVQSRPKCSWVGVNAVNDTGCAARARVLKAQGRDEHASPELYQWGGLCRRQCQ